MRRRKKSIELSNETVEFLIPYETKKSILGILLIFIGLLILLGIISYNRTDNALIQNLNFKDLLTIVDKDSELSQNSTRINNQLGLLGAIISNFLVNDFLGYFSIFIPILLFYWGIKIILKIDDFTQPIFHSILVFSIALLFSSMMGILANSLDIIAQNKEFYGSVGFMFGSILIRLLGSAGGIILVIVFLFVFITILMNINLRELLTNIILTLNFYIKATSNSILNLIKKEKTDHEAPVKIRNLKEKSKEQKTTESSTQKTKIEIIREETKENENGGRETSGSIITSSQQSQKSVEQNDEKSESKQKEELDGLPPWDDSLPFNLPTIDLLERPVYTQNINQDELTENAKMIENKLKIFNVEIQEIKVTPGPVVTLYEVIPMPNVKVSTITNLKNDLALALRARGIRLIAPMPGRGTIGVEIPNNSPEIVKVSSIFGSEKFRDCNYSLPLALGKTVSGEIFIEDLSSMPHLLIAGATGSGKSVGINTIINSLIFKLHPSKLKFVIVDPKRIELSMYKKLKYHYLAICPDVNEEIITSPENAVTVLKSLEIEMDKRYEWLSLISARNINDYNEKLSVMKLKEKNGIELNPLPYIVLIVDEFADLMVTVRQQIEESIARLAQKSRAAGIHLIFATQRPSVNIIRGSIKANFPARIAYRVSQRVDSATILDQAGAEQLLGSGDMIYINNSDPIRVQNAYISSEEINNVIKFIENQKGFAMPYLLPSVKKNKNSNNGQSGYQFDELIVEAANLVVSRRTASVTLLQRFLKIGYARAARVMDELEQIGIVGPIDGSKNRLVLVEDTDTLNRILESYNLL